MKITGKIFALFCSLLMVMSMFAGCGADIKEEVQEDAAEIKQEAEEVVGDAAVQAGAADQNSNSAGSEEIGEDAALKIALKDAGLKKSDVDRIKCELDYDDGRTEYEIEFRKGTTEYEYTVDAFSGKILEKDIDNDDD